MDHLLRGNFGSFVKSGRNGTNVSTFGVRCGGQCPALNNNQAQTGSGWAGARLPDNCLVNADTQSRI